MSILRSAIVFLALVFVADHVGAQTVFRLDFEDGIAPDDWTYSGFAEWGRVLGEGGGSYFRFHPVSWMDELRSPELDLAGGFYTLTFSWNEAAADNPDYCDIFLYPPNGPRRDLGRIGGGNSRTWQRDSIGLGMLEDGTYELEFAYRSTVRFPSQYLNLDNIELERRDVTSVQDAVSGTIAVYPNPVSNELFVDLDRPDDRGMALRLFSDLGQEVGSWRVMDTRFRIDVSPLPAGLYLLEFTSGGHVSTRKIIVQR